jgi:hypothetical protein
MLSKLTHRCRALLLRLRIRWAQLDEEMLRECLAEGPVQLAVLRAELAALRAELYALENARHEPRH